MGFNTDRYTRMAVLYRNHFKRWRALLPLV